MTCDATLPDYARRTPSHATAAHRETTRCTYTAETRRRPRFSSSVHYRRTPETPVRPFAARAAPASTGATVIRSAGPRTCPGRTAAIPAPCRRNRFDSGCLRPEPRTAGSGGPGHFINGYYFGRDENVRINFDFVQKLFGKAKCVVEVHFLRSSMNKFEGYSSRSVRARYLKGVIFREEGGVERKGSNKILRISPIDFMY